MPHTDKPCPEVEEPPDNNSQNIKRRVGIYKNLEKKSVILKGIVTDSEDGEVWEWKLKIS